jgi:hydrogenase maturation protease
VSTVGSSTEGAGRSEQLAYRARALAQAHPLSPLAERYLSRLLAVARASDPRPEVAGWGAVAFRLGYSVFRVAEADRGVVGGAVPRSPATAAGTGGPEGLLERVEGRVRLVAAELRSAAGGGPTARAPGPGLAGPGLPADADVAVGDVLGALELVVGSEVAKRAEQWPEPLDESVLDELGEHLAWWVVEGYALGVVEAATALEAAAAQRDGAEAGAGRVLVAGVGNVLAGDDGFGVEVARRLLASDALPGVRVVETGIGGVALLEELLGGVDRLVVVDAVDRGRPPGTVMLIVPDVPDVADLGVLERRDALADVHLATPSRVLLVAKALGVLPREVLLVGCQPEDADRLGPGLSPRVAAAVDVAIAEIARYVAEGRTAAPTPGAAGAT